MVFNSKRLVAWALGLLAAVPLARAQYYDGDRFYLSTEKIYAVGEPVQARLESRGLNWLDLRLYRLEDPAAYLLGLPGLHRPKTSGHVKSYDLYGLLHEMKQRTYLDIERLGRNWLRQELRRDARSSYSPLMDELKSGREPSDGPAMLPLRSYPLQSSWRQTLAEGEPGYDWSYSTLELPIHEAGVYLLEGVYEGDVGSTVVVVSNLGVLTKKSPDELLVFCVDRSSGLAVPGASVQLLIDGKVASDGTTDEHGLWRVKNPAIGRILVLAMKGKDFALSDPAYYPASVEPAKLYLYTERPLYRPGHEVLFKGVLRSFDAGGFHLPAAGTVSFGLYSPEGKELPSSAPVSVSEMGSFSGKFKLPADAALGKYTLEARWNGTPYQTEFFVEEYSAPDYIASVQFEAPAVLAGAALNAKVDVHYLYGDPLPDAPLRWTAYRSRYYPRFDTGDPLQFFYDEATYRSRASELVKSGSGRLGLDGKFEFQIPTEAPAADLAADSDTGYTYRVVVEVDDPDGRVVQGQGAARVTPAPFALLMETDRFVYRPGDGATIRLRSRDFADRPVASTVHLEARRPGASSSEPLWTRELTLGPTGATALPFTADTEGTLELAAEATDAAGNRFRTRCFVLVSADALAGATSLGSGGSGGLDVILDKSGYRPGDKARALILTPAREASVLLTVEGEGLFSAQVIELSNGMASVELPVAEAYTPNVTVSASLLIGDQFYQRERPLLVPPEHKVLKLEVKPNREEYAPGSAGSVEVRVTDLQGQPVANAEVCLGIVDEAIYTLQPELIIAPQQYFFHRRRNNVRTAISTTFKFYGYSEEAKLDLADAALDRSISFGMIKLASEGERKFFEDTVGFFPALRTDANGVARASFKLPDDLTKWRFTARAFTADTRVGEGLGYAVTRKSMSVSMGLPVLLNERDEVELPIVAHNQSASVQEVFLALEAIGAGLTPPAVSKGSVEPGKTLRFDWTLKPENLDPITLTASMDSLGGTDALEQKIPVAEHAVERVFHQWLVLGPAAAQGELSFDVPSLDRATLELTVASEAAQAIEEAVQYLIGYPYGCVEQTMSRLLPDLVAVQALKKAGVEDSPLEDQLGDLVNQGMLRLIRMQHEDGGWGWWKDDATDPFMTAYVLFGFDLASRADYTYDWSVQDAGRKALRALIDSDAMDPTQRAFALAVASADLWGEDGYPDLADRMFGGRERLPVQARAWLTQALMLLGKRFESSDPARAQAFQRKSEALLAELAAAAIAEPGSLQGPVHWGGAADTLAEEPVETTSVVLMTLAEAQPEHPLIDRGIAWLLTQRQAGHWATTRQTSFAVMALARRIRPDAPSSVSVQFLADGRELGRLAPEPGKPAPSLLLQADSLKLGPMRIRAVLTGDRSAVVGATLRLRDLAEGLPAESAGIEVLREVSLLTQSSGGAYQRLPLPQTLEPGERVLSKLTIRSSAPRQYLKIEDPVPGGCVAVKSLADYPVDGLALPGPEIRRELREGRVVFFVPRLEAGQPLELYSVLQVSLDGTFHHMPASAEEMYSPAHRGHSAEGLVRIARKESRP